MLVGFEASALQGCKSGVGYYTENLLGSIMRTAPEHDYVLFSNRRISDGWKQLGTERLYDRRFFPVRAAWMQAVLPGSLRDVQPDVCHFTNYLAPLACECPQVVTIYDMTVFITPRYHHFKKLILDRTLIPRVARRADAIITVSNSARNDILRYLKVKRDKVKVIPGAVSPFFRPVTDPVQLDEVRARYNLHQPFILYVGTIEPRKNLVRLIQAFANLKRNGSPHKLVIVGQQGWQVAPIFDEVERLGLSNEITFTGYAPIEDLPALYTLCEVMAFPSLYEGFGLPVLEAMACGAPVLTSKTSSLVEVASGAAMLVDPLSVDDISHALCRLHAEPDLRAHLREAGLENAARFSWEATARSTLDIYEHVAVTRKARERVFSHVGAPAVQDE
ncbi:MAG TPA: glycosyltransferase family 1 protein [Chloroflexia bacterium]|nr:glycosyltransferase family 1 protein [Chloroflexia bacterium]